jgi:hypothetical protein
MVAELPGDEERVMPWFYQELMPGAYTSTGCESTNPCQSTKSALS